MPTLWHERGLRRGDAKASSVSDSTPRPNDWQIAFWQAAENARNQPKGQISRYLHPQKKLSFFSGRPAAHPCYGTCPSHKIATLLPA